MLWSKLQATLSVTPLQRWHRHKVSVVDHGWLVTVTKLALRKCRSQLYDAEEQGSALMEQQEGAEDLVRALRQELHNLRQDTNNVAANARQTVSEKEALQVLLPWAFHVLCLGS